MRRLLIATLALTAIPLFSAGGSHRHDSNGHRGMSINVDDGWTDDGGPTTCDALRVTFDDEPAVRAEEELPVSSLRSLNVKSDQNGGIHVVGSNDSRFAVRVCKAAAFAEDLGSIRASLSGNTVTASGPDNSKWVAYFIVQVPRGAKLDLSTHNGPIGLHHVDADVNARAVNGPISIKDTTGTIDADTTNGPISIGGSSGTIKANASNGPISVKLDGGEWRGSLEAHTQNGPLSVKIGRNFRSGVVIESDGHGPVSCRAEACRQARRTWDDDDNRRIELGTGTPNVHMSTVNGPISVKEE